MKCRCTNAIEFYGREAQQYAAAQLVRDETAEDELRATYSCPDTGAVWELDFPPNDRRDEPGDARLRRVR